MSLLAEWSGPTRQRGTASVPKSGALALPLLWNSDAKWAAEADSGGSGGSACIDWVAAVVQAGACDGSGDGGGGAAADADMLQEASGSEAAASLNSPPTVCVAANYGTASLVTHLPQLLHSNNNK
eukprot:Sspe_Gene.74870::Locus_46789_Transcript_1_1_Confidence_1.000_Length_665::g.74870::m.74870